MPIDKSAHDELEAFFHGHRAPEALAAIASKFKSVPSGSSALEQNFSSVTRMTCAQFSSLSVPVVEANILVTEDTNLRSNVEKAMKKLKLV